MMPENSTSNPETRHSDHSRTVWLVLGALTVFTYFFGLTIPLVGPDEPRYAQVAREMFERGDWVTPTLGGHTWFEKPALLYWLEIASYHVFGVNEFAARFGSAVFGLGTVFCLWLIGRYGDRTGERSSRLANWFALVGATSIGLIVFSRGASFDIILTFPIAAALTGFYIFDRTETAGTRGDRRALAAFYFFVGVALVAKGLVGIVFPYAIVAFYFLISRRFPSRVFIVSLFWGTVVSVVAACSWYLPVYLANGWPFIDEFFIQHHFQRYLTNKYFHPQPFYFFWWVLPLMTIPWLPFFLNGIWRGVKQFRTEISGSAPSPNSFCHSPLLMFSTSWLLVPLVFFSFSGSKLPGYILPAVPAAIIITAVSVAGFAVKNPVRESILKAIAAATLVTVVALLIFVVPSFADGDSTKRMFDAANDRGYSKTKVVCMHHLVHNAEFYAAGRMLRDGDGKLAKLLGPNEVLAEIHRQNGEPLLVLVPLEYEKQLTGTSYLSAEVIGENSETALMAVRERK